MSKLFISALLLLASLPFAPLSAHADFKSGISAFIERDEDAVLPPDQAFQLAVQAIDAQTLQASFTITPGHYLYRDRIKFEVVTPANSAISTELPHGDIKQDPTFGQTEVFHHDVTTLLKLATPANGAVMLRASYQGCSEKGLCYAPIHKTFELALGGTSTAPGTPPGAEDGIARVLQGGQLWLIVGIFFLAGLLVSFTPCMLPMIPIVSGIIVGSNSTSRMQSFNLSLAYTMGMALCYTLAGIAAGLSGHLLSSSLQSPWILASSAIVFVLLALAMFGLYELRLPSAIQTRMVERSNRIKGGRIAGVFIMGALSALILSPCVAPALVGALVYISQTRDVVLGGSALFAMSLGMGVPLLLIGASAGALLPRSGPWMGSVRNFFGVLMLGVAIWVVSPLLPVALQLGLWGALLIIPAIFMHALDSLPVHAPARSKLAKGAAIIMLVAGISLVVGALSGARSPLQPLAGLFNKTLSSQQSSNLPFQRIHSLAELESQLKAAQGKPVMLDFYADWCVACKELEHFTFSDPRVAQALAGVVLLQADVTADSIEDRALLQRFKLFGPPGIVFFGADGVELAVPRVIGYQNADRFLSSIKPVTGR